MRRLIAAVLSMALIGACSFALPGAGKIRRDPDMACKTASRRPGADTVMAVLGIVMVVGGVVVSRSDASDEPADGVFLALPGGLMTVFGVLGTVHGERSLSACQEREGAQGGTRTRTVLTTGT